MELTDNRDELAWTAKLLHYLPQAISADSVEGLCEIDKSHEQVIVLLLAFFLELACSKYYVDSSTSSTETALAFWKETLLKVLIETVEQDAS